MEFAGKGDKTEKLSLSLLWKQRMDIYSQVTGKTGADIVPYILQGLDDEGLIIFNSFTLSADDKKDPVKIYEQFEDRLNISKPNFCTARLDLHFYYQQTDESLDEFYTRCKEKTKNCAFTHDEEKERIIEQLLASTPIEDFRKWLLDQEQGVTMETVLKEGRKYEVTQNSIRYLQDRSLGVTSMVSGVTSTSTDINAITQYNRGSGSKCKRCGTDHKNDIQNCPAKDSRCYYCQVIGHWKQFCLRRSQWGGARDQHTGTTSTDQHRRYSRGGTRGRGHGDRIHGINTYEDDAYYEHMGEFETVEYNMIHIRVSDISSNTERDEAYGKIQIHVPGSVDDNVKRYLKLKVDTGAQGNTLPLRTFRNMMPDKLDDNGYPNRREVNSAENTTLTAYNGTTIRCFGSVTLNCRLN